MTAAYLVQTFLCFEVPDVPLDLFHHFPLASCMCTDSITIRAIYIYPLFLCSSGVARSLVLAGHLLYGSPLALPSHALPARSCDMSGMNMALWLGTCLARPALHYATAT